MAQGLVEEAYLSALGSAFRKTFSTSTTYKPSQFVNGVNDIISNFTWNRQSVSNFYWNTASALPPALFYSANGLKDLFVSGVTTIPGLFTYSAQNLTRIEFPDATTASTIGFADISSAISVPTTAAYNAAFWSLSGSQLSLISLPKLTSIGSAMFMRAHINSNTNLYIPSCTKFNSFCFYAASILCSLPVSNIISVEYHAFYNCTLSSNTALSFDNLTTTGESAFKQCNNLTEVTLKKADYVGSNCFQGCNSLTTVRLNSATAISFGAFSTCTKLSNISIPMIKTIGNYVFYQCTSLSSINVGSCSDIGTYCFSAAGLKNITFDNTVYVNIQSNAFLNTPLSSISVKATNIGSSAFTNCKSLSQVTLTFSVSTASIYSYAFRSCYNLLSLKISGSVIPKLGTVATVFASTPISNYTTSTGGTYGSIYVPSSLYASFKASTNWVNVSNRMVSY